MVVTVTAGDNARTERERRRWASTMLHQRRYPSGTPADEIHLDLRVSPRVTLLNLVRSEQAYDEHATCVECAEILTEAGRWGDAPVSEQQWDTFRARWRGNPRGDH